MSGCVREKSKAPTHQAKKRLQSGNLVCQTSSWWYSQARQRDKYQVRYFFERELAKLKSQHFPRKFYPKALFTLGCCKEHGNLILFLLLVSVCRLLKKWDEKWKVKNIGAQESRWNMLFIINSVCIRNKKALNKFLFSENMPERPWAREKWISR